MEYNLNITESKIFVRDLRSCFIPPLSVFGGSKNQALNYTMYRMRVIYELTSTKKYFKIEKYLEKTEYTRSMRGNLSLYYFFSFWALYSFLFLSENVRTR